MRDINTQEIRKFTEEELNEIYEAIGGKEKVLDYLRSITYDEKRRAELEKACYELQIITSNELAELWDIK